MNATRGKCPVCWRIVFPDGGNMWRHRDTIGKWCQMSGEPFALIEQHEEDVA